MPNKQAILWTLLLLLVSIYFFGMTDVDISLQDYFYQISTHTWVLDTNAQPWHFIFYTGIKKLLITVGVGFLIVFIFFRTSPHIKAYKQGLLVVILSAIFVPTITGGLKKTTNMPCPKDEIHYGGTYPRTAVWESYSKALAAKPNIACWPAGHASGGFALMALFFLFKRKRNQYLALTFALLTGWSMGLYKMMIGDHFFSHTWISMLLAWLIILLLQSSVTYFYTKKR